MADKDKIKQEIERLKKESLEGKKDYYDYYDGVGDACDEMLQFINSLSEEPVNEDLEEELHSWIRENCDDNGFFNQLELARHFAEWQKQQMMKDAVDAQVFQAHDIDKAYEGYVYIVSNQFKGLNLLPPNKVKIIIVKED